MVIVVSCHARPPLGQNPITRVYSSGWPLASLKYIMYLNVFLCSLCVWVFYLSLNFNKVNLPERNELFHL